MSIDATSPKDSDLVSTLAQAIRDTRTALNTVEASVAAGSALVFTELNISAGTTALAVGTDLSSAMLEMVKLTASGSSDISEITGGTAGQVKIFILGDANVRFKKDVTKIALNQMDAEEYYGGTQYDVIAFVNLGGNPSTPTNGVWWELWRTPRVD